MPGQLVREIETQAIQAQQQISLARSQLAGKQREMRLAQLTRAEISLLPAQTAVYEGVGKMYAPLVCYGEFHVDFVGPGSCPYPLRTSTRSWRSR